MSINKVTLIGNLGQDPQVSTFSTANGTGSITRISIATNEKDGQGNTITDWHNVSIFGKLGEVAAKYLHKGSQVYVEGKLKTNKYKDKDGVEKVGININVQGYSGVLRMLDRKQETTAAPSDDAAVAGFTQSMGDTDHF